MKLNFRNKFTEINSSPFNFTDAEKENELKLPNCKYREKCYFQKLSKNFKRKTLSLFVWLYVHLPKTLMILTWLIKHCIQQSVAAGYKNPRLLLAQRHQSASLFRKNIVKKHLCLHDKNYCYFCKSTIPVIYLIVGSWNMIKVSNNMIL